VVWEGAGGRAQFLGRKREESAEMGSLVAIGEKRRKGGKWGRQNGFERTAVG